MNRSPIFRFLLNLRMLVIATLAPPLALGQSMLPVPMLPLAGEPTWIAILGDSSYLEGHSKFVLRRDGSDEAPIPVRMERHGFLISVNFQALPAGPYVAEYYADSLAPASPEVPTLSMRFVVSAKGPMRVVEYFNPELGHYFLTGYPAEIEGLDSGAIAGWQRTGESFNAFAPGEIPSFGEPVCRFYGLPSAGLNSHFFSSSPDECAAVQSAWPDQWLLETPVAFGTITRKVSSDTSPRFDCDRPLYRLYNNRPDNNHRYTVSVAIRDQMIAQGWVFEGFQYDPYEPPYTMCVLQ